MISLAFNTFTYGVDIKDFFEIFRILYNVVVMVMTGFYIKRLGVMPAFGFVIGVILSGIVAYMNPMNPDVLGTPQIFNPNVIGNVLAVAVVFCSFGIINGYPIVGGALALVAAMISFFTFSKGTWLMSIFGLLACYLAMTSLGGGAVKTAHRIRKYTGYLLFVGLAITVYRFWDMISLILEAKFMATDFAATAAEGGSASARAGLILSSVYMAMMNPLLGVGISNYEHVNHLLKDRLGNNYYDDDNPNSAWFYVLGCIGLPAFFLWSFAFYWFLSRVYQIPLGKPVKRMLYTACVGLVFFIGGNVQVEMLKAYYYWVALGVFATNNLSLNKRVHA
jgi:hypothetical protein